MRLHTYMGCLGFLTFACRTGDIEDPVSDTRQSLIEECQDTVVCTTAAGSTQETLRLAGGGCVVRGAVLLPDGHVKGSTEASWSAQEDSVRVCQSGVCFACSRAEADGGEQTANSPREPRCRGSAACPSAPPCAVIRGCSLHTHYRYDGNGQVSGTELSCIGSANPCDSMSSEGTCRAQGCVWK